MLLYNTDGTVSNIIVTSVIDGKATSSLQTAPTIQQAFEASASNAIINRATNAGSSSAVAYGLGNVTSTNTSNLGTTYLSSATVQRQVGLYVQYPFPSGSATSSANLFSNGVLVSSSKQAEEVRYATSADLHTRGQINYWITGSTIIPASALNTGSFFVTSSTGLGPVNTSAKVSITSSYFTPLFNSNINDSNDVKKFGILSYNGVISTIAGYNDFSSSTFNNYTQSFVVMHVSASKANMGSVVTNDLIVSLGTTQNRS
jgi:hypothetical protein